MHTTDIEYTPDIKYYYSMSEVHTDCAVDFKVGVCRPTHLDGVYPLRQRLLKARSVHKNPEQHALPAAPIHPNPPPHPPHFWDKRTCRPDHTRITRKIFLVNCDAKFCDDFLPNPNYFLSPDFQGNNCWLPQDCFESDSLGFASRLSCPLLVNAECNCHVSIRAVAYKYLKLGMAA